MHPDHGMTHPTMYSTARLIFVRIILFRHCTRVWLCFHFDLGSNRCEQLLDLSCADSNHFSFSRCAEHLLILCQCRSWEVLSWLMISQRIAKFCTTESAPAGSVVCITRARRDRSVTIASNRRSIVPKRVWPPWRSFAIWRNSQLFCSRGQRVCR